MSFLCVTALASWMLPTPRVVVLYGESGNRLGPQTHVARERTDEALVIEQRCIADMDPIVFGANPGEQLGLVQILFDMDREGMARGC